MKALPLRISTLLSAAALLALAPRAEAKLGSCNDPVVLGTSISETDPFSTLADRWRKMTEVFAEE